MQSDCRLEVLPLLAESVGEAGQAVTMHPHGVVLLFDIGS